MELTVFSNETMPSGRQKKEPRPTLTVTKHGNKLRFSTKAVELMELKVGSKCSFAHEKGKPKEWYAFLDEKYGYNLQGCKGGAVAVQNGRLVAYMLECLGVKDGRTVTITIGSEPTSFNLDRNALWPLITAAIKQ